MEIIKKIVIIVLILLFALVIGRNIILKLCIEYGADMVTGMDVSIRRIDLDFVDTRIMLRDLSVKNPEGFEEEYLCLIPRIEIDFDVMMFVTQRVVGFELIEFDIEKLFMVKNKEGVLNLSLLAGNKKVKEEVVPKKKDAEEKKEKKPALDLYIKQFILTMREVGFVDEGRPTMKRQVIDMRIDREEFNDITDIAAITSIITLKLLQNQTIGRLPLGLDIGAATESLEGFTQSTVNQVDALASTTLKTVSSTASQLGKTGTETVSKSTETVKKAMFGLTDKAKGVLSGKD